jgi:GNAT superfamily N-acetyltransferase
MMQLRAATAADVPALQALMERSVRGLSAPWYTPAQVDAALRHLLGVDSQLIADGSYYVVEHEGAVAAAGGWSARRTLYGGDQAKAAHDPWLDPAADAARLRAFFVDPAWARRGLARRLFAACEEAAWAAGYRTMELVATLPGVALYTALGFETDATFEVPLPGDLALPCAHMVRALAPPPA